MTLAGSIPSPIIIPLKKEKGSSLSNITVNDYVCMNCENDTVDIYFTSDGSKPDPYKLKINGVETTHLYVGPFLLKNGKRVLKAIAHAEKKDIVSNVTTKTFVVGNCDRKTNELNSMSERRLSVTKSDIINKRGNKNTLETSIIPSQVSSDMPIINANINLPDGPFTTTNYSGTQINVWGVSPSNLYPMGQQGQQDSFNENTEGCAKLTNQLLKNSGSNNDDLVRRDELTSIINSFLKKDKENISVVDKPKIKSTSTNPPSLKTQGLDFDEIFAHIRSQLEFYCTKNTSFKQKFSTLKLDKLLNAFVTSEGADVNINLRFAPSGVNNIKKSITNPVSLSVKLPPRKVSVVKVAVKKKSIVKPPPPPPEEANKKKIVGRRSSLKDKKLKQDEVFLQSEEYEQEATLKPWEAFNPERDAELLRDAMKGLGTDETKIVDIMGYRSFDQRTQVVEMFKTLFGKDLPDELKSELSGNFKTICTELCLRPAELDAKHLYDSMKGLGTDEDALTEILCSRTNAQIKAISEMYHKIYKQKLESDVKGDTSGCYRKVMLCQVAANRIEDVSFDKNAAIADAKKLFTAGEEKWGTDESTFINILCKRSFSHLRCVFDQYSQLSKKTILEAVESEFSGDIKTALKTVVRVIQDKPAYFAYKLQKAIKGLGTDDRALVRVVISRCEVDMVQIKTSFLKQFSKSLADWIKGDTSGDYCKMILALTGDRDAPIVTQDDLDAVGDPPELEEMEEVKVQETPSLLPFSNFDVNADCQVLKKAMKGFGTDEDAIINVMAFRSADQRVQIVDNYKKIFNKDLRKELKSEISGDFEEAIIALCEGQIEHDAFQLHKAMKGLGTDENGLVDILCTRSSEKIEKIREYYNSFYKSDLEKDIESETSGHFKRLLVSMVQANRPDGLVIDRAKARKDAQLIHEAADKIGTDESRFNAILCSRSYAQLRATFEEYKKLTNKDIKDTIADEMSGDLKAGMTSIVQCVENKSRHFATRLHESTKGIGTDDAAVIRIVVGQCEIDMVQIKTHFQEMYQSPLGKYLSEDISGDYKKTIMALIGEKLK